MSPTPVNINSLKWWQRAVFYEILPISFQDSNGDGKGDLPGLISRIDYLEWLGVDAIWLTPIFRSPMLDVGYDIADFCAIDPLFGSLHDFDRLVELLHSRGMRVILDFVPNHTSDSHSWFRESRSSRSNAKRNWYVWALRITGSAGLAAALGNGMRKQNNTITTLSYSNNQT
jgi:alpha-glucosidase